MGHFCGEYMKHSICGDYICLLLSLCREDSLACQDWLLRSLNIMPRGKNQKQKQNTETPQNKTQKNPKTQKIPLVVRLEKSPRFYVVRCDTWVILPLVLCRWRVLLPSNKLCSGLKTPACWDSYRDWQQLGLLLQPQPAPDLPRDAVPWGAVPGPALLPMAALQEGAWCGQKWPFLAPSLKSIAGPDYQQGLVSSGLGLSSSSENEAVGVGTYHCFRRDAGRQTATGHSGRHPRPGILFFCPCLSSWRQLGFIAYSELHLWGIYEGWLISSS